MRRRSLEAQVLAGLVVAVLVVAGALVAYVAVTEGTAAVRAGLAVRALQMGGIAVGGAVVAVVAAATYAHWLNVTERSHREHREHRPGTWEIALAGVVVAVIGVGAWPVLTVAYDRSVVALSETDLAWAVGYVLLGIAYVWLLVWSLMRFVPWARSWIR
jgi:hypothetical protein